MANKILAFIFLVMTAVAAPAATFNISAGASVGTINSTIATAAGSSGSNTVQFAAGTYSIAWGGSSSAISVPCPASGTLTIQGPTTTYGQSGVLNSWQARPTAIINNTNTGGSATNLFHIPACTNPIIVQYLKVDGKLPSTGGGSFSVDGGASNVTFRYNWFTGNQEVVPFNCGDFWCYDDQSLSANLIALTGDYTTNTNNIHISWNIFGDPSLQYTGNASGQTGTCSNIMYFVYAAFPDGTSAGYDTTGGFCNAVGSTAALTNVFVDHNIIAGMEQGMKSYEGCQSNDKNYPNCLIHQVNVRVTNNDFQNIHRIAWETQQSPTDPSNPTIMDFNDFHDPVYAFFGSWGLSGAQNRYTNFDNNLWLFNGSGANRDAHGIPAAAEFWGSGTQLNNLIQAGGSGCTTSPDCGAQNASSYLAWDTGGGSTDMVMQKNIGQGSYNSPSTSVANIFGGEGGGPVPNGFSDNQVSNTVSTVASAACSISPNGGSFSGSQVVTVTDAGVTGGGYGPQGNTGIWVTIDGSTPAPRSGTSIYYDTGNTFTLTSNATVKCVGMWGSQNQPGAYASGFGFVPSSVVSATFTGGGTPTTATPQFSPVDGTTFTTTQSVTVTSSTAGAAIVTCQGAGCTPSTTYSGPITLSATTILRASATASGFAPSTISQATYTKVTPGAVATPTFSPAAPLTFTNSINVGISTATAGATLYYTTDGSTPTTGSTVYTGPILVSSTQTVKAIGTNVGGGFTTSAVGSATYTASLFLGNNLLDNSTSNTYPGAFNGIYAVTGTASGGYNITGCVVNQGTAAVTSGSHTACVVNLATSPTTQSANALCSGTYTNTGSTGTIAQIAMSGCPTLAANTAYWISSITDDPLQPSGLGFNDCGSTCTGGPPTLGVGTYASFYFGGTYGTYTGMPTILNKGLDQVTQYLTLTPATATAATPIISPASSTFPTSVSVTITDTTPGAVIHYTVDGSTPTGSSPTYSGAISVTTTTTVQAIAIAGGFLNSAIAANTYTITGASSIASVKVASASQLNFVVPGSADQFTVSITYTDGTTTSPLTRVGALDPRGSFVYSVVSSNPSVATIDNNLQVMGISSTLNPNFTKLTFTVKDSSGTLFSPATDFMEGVGNSLTAGYR